MTSKTMSPDVQAPAHSDEEVERLSRELKEQVHRAKDRISDRYSKLMEEPSFAPRENGDG